jgi:hypothetical protein
LRIGLPFRCQGLSAGHAELMPRCLAAASIAFPAFVLSGCML